MPVTIAVVAIAILAGIAACIWRLRPSRQAIDRSTPGPTPDDLGPPV